MKHDCLMMVDDFGKGQPQPNGRPCRHEAMPPCAPAGCVGVPLFLPVIRASSKIRNSLGWSTGKIERKPCFNQQLLCPSCRFSNRKAFPGSSKLELTKGSEVPGRISLITLDSTRRSGS